MDRARELVAADVKVIDDAFAVVNDPEIDVVVELIGGYGIARELAMQAIANGKHVVTANKARWPCMALSLPLPPAKRA